MWFTNFGRQLFKVSHLLATTATTRYYGFVYGTDQLITRRLLYYCWPWRWLNDSNAEQI